jgi:hypothetical protein
MKHLFNCIEQQVVKVKSNVVSMLSAARLVSIGTYIWTKKGFTMSYIGVSAAFYEPNRKEPVHVLLNLHAINHPHIGDAVAAKLQRSMVEWSIDADKVFMLITDNGSNMLKGIRLLKEMAQADEDQEEPSDTDTDTTDSENSEDPNADILGPVISHPEANRLFHRLPCLAHSIQLVIHSLDKTASYTNLLGKARSNVHSIRKSSVATQRLIEKAGKTVIPDCTTRWNSSYLMLKRLISIRAAVNEVLESIGCDTLLVSEWQRLEEVCALFEPFAEHTQIMQKDTIALPSVLPVLLDLLYHLQGKKDAKYLTDMSTIVLNATTSRFQKFWNDAADDFDVIPAAACYLDPSLATVLFTPEMVGTLASARAYIFDQVIINMILIIADHGNIFKTMFCLKHIDNISCLHSKLLYSIKRLSGGLSPDVSAAAVQYI